MTHYDWTQIIPEQLNPHTTRKAIHSGNMTIARLELRKDAQVAEHSHHNEQIKFAIDGGHKVVRAGETLVFPPNVPHGVVALEDTVVFDAFAPRRDDRPR